MQPAALSKGSLRDSASLSSAMDELTDGLDTGLDLTVDDGSSIGSDSEINGASAYRKTDKYGFIGGAQFTGEGDEVSAEVIRQREMKWLEMDRNWDKWISKKHKKVRIRCRKGIPASMRARCWPMLCGGKVKMQLNKDKFAALDGAPGDKQWLDTIEKDLHRQFPFHEMFASREGHGQRDLYHVLKAYTVYQPQEGYCQAQGPLAAVLLMQMPAEEAFWCLVQICELYVPGYYSQGLEAVQLDGQVLFGLLRKVSPVAYRHLKKHQVDPLLYMTEWFLCLFSRTLPWATMLRVWDMFFSEGVKVIFRVALVLLKVTLGSSDKLKDCEGLVETLEKLRNIPPRFLQENFLIHEISELAISQSAIERECASQLKKWRKKRGELKNAPRPRLFGARAVHELGRAGEAARSRPEDPSTGPGLPSIVVQEPCPPVPSRTPKEGEGKQRRRRKEREGESRAKPAARSSTFYLNRKSLAVLRPVGGAAKKLGSDGEAQGSKRNSEPLFADTYF